MAVGSDTAKGILHTDRLISAPVSGYPDPKSRYYLDTDASDVRVGAVLSQVRQARKESLRITARHSAQLNKITASLGESFLL